MSLDLQSSFYASDNCVLEKIHGSVFMSQVVRRKFGNTNLRKNIPPIIIVFVLWQ